MLRLDRVVLREGPGGAWRCYEQPRRVLAAWTPDEVLQALEAVAETVEQEGLHAAGFLAYEAAPGFDPALAVQDARAFPLLCFGLYDAPRETPELPAPRTDAPGALDWQPDVTEAQFSGAIRRIREWLRAGDTYQVNYTHRLRTAFRGDPWQLFLQLAAAQDAPYAAYLELADWAICSASPELFFTLEGDRITSQPMKGTAARGLWSAQDEARAAALRQSEKDRAENVMIVDMVRNDLGRIARTGSVQAAPLFEVQRFPAAWQMVSTVAAQTPALLPEIFRGLFPAASITGAPKARTMQIIAGLEQAPRRIYTGAIGWIAPGRRAQFNVAIRTILCDKRRGEAEYGVGGGIVWDSQAQDEYRECQTKARTLRAAPPSFDLLETLLWTPAEGYALLDEHLERLQASADYFAFRCDVAEVRIRLEALELRGMCRVRLLLSKRGGLRLEHTALAPVDLTFQPVALSAEPVDVHDPFLYHKTTHRAIYERCRATRPGFSDVLLFNEAGELTESTIANVAVEEKGRLYTPPIHCGLLPGTCRARLLREGRLIERVIPLEDLRTHTHVYLFNAVRGLQRVPLAGR